MPRGNQYGTVEDRFQQRAIPSSNGCWEWQGRKTTRGYGSMQIDGKRVRAHRVAYEMFVGPIPVGLEIDHLCRNTSCVNPSHLEAVPHRVNTQRGDAGKHMSVRTHCNAGHDFNTHGFIDRRGYRKCRICCCAYSKKYHEAHQAQNRKRCREYYHRTKNLRLR